jgi:hypothetical protein
MAKVVTCSQKFTPEEFKLASKIRHKNPGCKCHRIDQEGRGRGIVERTLADVNKKTWQVSIINTK